MYHDEDYFNPDDFLENYEIELRDIISKGIKDKYENLIRQLNSYKESNDKLTKENGRLRQLEISLIQKEREIEDKIKHLEKNFYKEKFEEILKDVVTTGYTVNWTYVSQEKCHLCDDDRKIEFTTKDGSITKLERCSCNDTVRLYKPTKISVYKIKINKRDNWNKKDLWMNVKYHTNDYSDKELDLEYKTVYEKFEEENKDNYYGSIYLSESECQKHCDYLNRKEIMTKPLRSSKSRK